MISGMTSRLKFFHMLIPSLGWLRGLDRQTMRFDAEAGAIGAILILPQAFALATLAGMPPEYGIYTSIFPVIIAALWGSSRHTLSGPNTALCVLIAYSVAPFAGVGNDTYIGYVLALTFMVGVIELSLGMLRLGAVLDFISKTVIAAIVLAVSLIIIVSAGSALLGVMANFGEPFHVKVYQFMHDIPHANGYSLAVGLTTVITGLMARRIWKRYALVIGMAAGVVVSLALNAAYGPATTGIELIGNLSVAILPLSLPRFDMESLYVIQQMLASAFAIAFLGLMQTVVIARSIAEKSGQLIDTNQEIIGQGFSNLAGSFLSSFASSGSFNRSAAHFEVGARTPMAAVYASLLLGLIALAGGQAIAYIPMPAVAGALILVGYGLIDINSIRQITRMRQEMAIFLLTLAVALWLGLNAGVFTGLALSLVVYLWYASTPNVGVEMHTARDGRPVSVVTIDGNLFFGSVRHVARLLSQLGEQEDNNIFLLRTDHLTYLDVPGAAMLAAEAKRRRAHGDEIYIYVTRSSVLKVLQDSGMLKIFGEQNIIHRGLDHPMKYLLHPKSGSKTDAPILKGQQLMQDLARHLHTLRLFSHIPLKQLNCLLGKSAVASTRAGDILLKEGDSERMHLVLLDGEIEAERTWSTPEGHDHSVTWTLAPPETGMGFSFLGSASRVRARALTDARYLTIDGDLVDELAGWNQRFTEEFNANPELQRRMGLIKQIGIFRDLPLENVSEAFKHMRQREVQAGESVITQGEKGDAFYLIDTGEAEIIRTDPMTDETNHVAQLGPGDSFGEESLLQEGYRNATVNMITPGQLLVLDKSDFDELIRPTFVEEVTAEQAMEMIKTGKASWIDCRYDMEYEESHIPGAKLLPLDTIRSQIHTLDPDATYVVYCRSGRRSKAAAFILRERNLKAMSMAGGIKGWPFEVEISPT